MKNFLTGGLGSSNSGYTEIIRSDSHSISAASASSYGNKTYQTEGAILANPASPANTPTDDNNSNMATTASNNVIYRMGGVEVVSEEKKTMHEDEEVERIVVSAVSKGLRRSSRQSQQQQQQQQQQVKKSSSPTPKLAPPRDSPNRRHPKPRKSSSATASRPSSKQQARPPQTSSSRSSKPSQSSSRRKPRHYRSKNSKRGVEVVPIVSDDDTDTLEDSSSSDSDVDCEYNYIDDESYGDSDTYSSDSHSTYSSSQGDSGTNPEELVAPEDDDDSANGSLRTGIDSSFDDHPESERPDFGSHGSGRQAHEQNNRDDDDDPASFYYHRGDTPQGLDIVAHLLNGAREVSLDASSVRVSGNTPIHEVARHISDALAQTTCLQKVFFCGPWSGSQSKQRLALEILFDGLLDNTSVHTVVLKDNPSFDRYAGYAFGTMLKTHGRLQTLEIQHCRFVWSGWSSLFLGLQHSKSVKKLCVENCHNLSSVDIDGISSTIQYLGLEAVRLSRVRLHKIHPENLAFLFRAFQKTKTIKEVDLSHNHLGGVPRVILLLAKCLAGDPVWIGSESSGSSGETKHLPISYHHHIEKLHLVNCGIDKASVKTLARALDSTHAKLDASGNEHPLVVHTLNVSQNNFGNSGAKLWLQLLEANPKITSLGMVGCHVSASRLKDVADRLRYNNSFLQKIGLSSDVSLAILDSVSAVEHVFGGGKSRNSASNGTTPEGGDSDIETSSQVRGCGGC